MMLLILAYCCCYSTRNKTTPICVVDILSPKNGLQKIRQPDSMDFRFKRYIRVCLIFYAIQVAKFSACSKMLSGLFILDFVCMRCDGKFNDSLFSFDATALGQLLSTIYSWSEKIAQKKSETLYFVVFTRFMHKSGTHIYIQYIHSLCKFHEFCFIEMMTHLFFFLLLFMEAMECELSLFGWMAHTHIRMYTISIYTEICMF